MFKRIKKLIFRTLLILFCWGSLHTIFITIHGFSQDTIKADAALVFGSTVYRSGELSQRLKERCLRAVKLYKDSLIDYIVVSGGLGKEGHLEGSKMRTFLVSQQIPADAIIVDNNGYNTRLSALNFKSIAKDHHITSVFVVSQFYHITRCQLSLNQVGFKKVYKASPKYFEKKDLYSLTREFIGYYYYLIAY